MKAFLTGLLAIIITFICLVMFLIWVGVFTFGGMEILWWIFTGDFFHFAVNTQPASVF